MSVNCKTICVECRYHNGVPPSTVWYKHRCLHPDKTRSAEQDPVSGIIGYTTRNDLGQINIGTKEERYPNCRDINRGNCSFYVSKE